MPDPGNYYWAQTEDLYFCIRCEQFFPREKFQKASRSLSGVSAYCRACDTAYAGERRKAQHDPFLAAAYNAMTELMKTDPALFADIIRRNRPVFEPIWQKHKERCATKQAARKKMFVTLECERCHALFEKPRSYVAAKKREGTHARFCSRDCALGICREVQVENRVRGARHPMTKLTDENVHEIRRLHATGEYSYSEIGRRFGVTPKSIGSIIKGRTWGHLKEPVEVQEDVEIREEAA